MPLQLVKYLHTKLSEQLKQMNGDSMILEKLPTPRTTQSIPDINLEQMVLDNGPRRLKEIQREISSMMKTIEKLRREKKSIQNLLHAIGYPDAGETDAPSPDSPANRTIVMPRPMSVATEWK